MSSTKYQPGVYWAKHDSRGWEQVEIVPGLYDAVLRRGSQVNVNQYSEIIPLPTPDELVQLRDELDRRTRLSSEVMAGQLRTMERLNAQLAAMQEENRQLRQHIASLETSCANLRTLATAAGDELNQLKARRRKAKP